MAPVKSFRDKVAVVTGGGGGIGGALSRQLARAGAVVIVADVDEESAAHVAAEATALGARAQAATLDVAVATEVQELVDRVVREQGRLDLMINNAGILVGGAFGQIPLDLWRHAIEVNFWGVLHGTHAAWGPMMRQRSGDIVNVASISGIFPGILCTPYVASKFSIVGLGQALRAEGADHGIRVITVCPGFARTGLFERHGFSRGLDSTEFERTQPMRFMEPDEVARRILRAVRRNKGLVVFPASARFLCWAQRISPRLVTRLTRRMLRRPEVGLLASLPPAPLAQKARRPDSSRQSRMRNEW
jgi:NAD(P)-dependent dehydrogenase (short-subunit alcohol dehydrogenase family)